MTDAANAAWGALVFHQGDWMKKALVAAKLPAKDMADYLEVDVATVSRWLGGKQRPSKQTLRLWALKTGAPLEYLETGRLPMEPDDGGVGPTGLEPMTSTVEYGRFAALIEFPRAA